MYRVPRPTLKQVDRENTRLQEIIKRQTLIIENLQYQLEEKRLPYQRASEMGATMFQTGLTKDQIVELHMLMNNKLKQQDIAVPSVDDLYLLLQRLRTNRTIDDLRVDYGYDHTKCTYIVRDGLYQLDKVVGRHKILDLDLHFVKQHTTQEVASLEHPWSEDSITLIVDLTGIPLTNTYNIDGHLAHEAWSHHKHSPEVYTLTLTLADGYTIFTGNFVLPKLAHPIKGTPKLLLERNTDESAWHFNNVSAVRSSLTR